MDNLCEQIGADRDAFDSASPERSPATARWRWMPPQKCAELELICTKPVDPGRQLPGLARVSAVAGKGNQSEIGRVDARRAMIGTRGRTEIERATRNVQIEAVPRSPSTCSQARSQARGPAHEKSQIWWAMTGVAVNKARLRTFNIRWPSALSPCWVRGSHLRGVFPAVRPSGDTSGSWRGGRDWRYLDVRAIRAPGGCSPCPCSAVTIAVLPLFIPSTKQQGIETAPGQPREAEHPQWRTHSAF